MVAERSKPPAEGQYQTVRGLKIDQMMTRAAALEAVVGRREEIGRNDAPLAPSDSLAMLGVLMACVSVVLELAVEAPGMDPSTYSMV